AWRGDAIQMQVLAGLVGGPSVGKAIDRANVPLVDLGSVAARNGGGVKGSGDIKLSGSTPVRAKSNGGLTTLGGVHADGNGGPGKESATAGPTGVAQVGTTIATVPVT